MNDYSLNETANRFRLAAKGAGYSWGYADEISRAGYWLASRNLPASDMIATLLQLIQASNDLNHHMPVISGRSSNAEFIAETNDGDWLCPVMLGAAISDGFVSSANGEEIICKNVKCPLLLIPFIADFSLRIKRVVSVRLDSLELLIDESRIRIPNDDVAALDKAAEVVISTEAKKQNVLTETDVPILTSRVDVQPATWHLLEALAHRTYAPATESSRMLGAGAGIQDND